MAQEKANNHEGPLDDGAPAHVLNDPDVQAEIAAARRRIDEGRVSRSGKTSDDLLRLAREQRLDPGS